MTPQAFCKVRALAIETYGIGKKSKWTVLGRGSIFNGELGAVKILDQRGCTGVVTQQYVGAGEGMTLTPVPDDYVEQPPNL